MRGGLFVLTVSHALCIFFIREDKRSDKGSEPLVDYVQRSDNSLLFIRHVYAQQILSVASAILSLAALIYINTVIKRMKKAEYL